MLTESRPTASQGATAVGKIIAKALLGLAIALWGAATVHAQSAATSVRPENSSASMMPGSTPAMNSLAIDTSALTP